ncbi:MAG: pyruvate, phosphate dikinase [Desulfococcus sp. 4484_242]|nr:MAG: pyruvate, phosphate dikinase [Desulfococcus sp. 4484_242]
MARQGVLTMESKALEVNLACTRVDVTVDNRYEVLLEVMSEYYGVKLGLQTFLEEICHPYRNWAYIVKETRSYALNYFHVLKSHPRGGEAVTLYCDIFFEAIAESRDEEVKTDAADHLLLFLEHIIRDGGDALTKWLPVVDYVFDRIRETPQAIFFLFVRSFYQLSRIGRLYGRTVASDTDCTPLNRLLERYLRFTYRYWLDQEDPLIWFERESGVEVRGEKLVGILNPVSHGRLKTWLDDLDEAVKLRDKTPQIVLKQLLELPGYGQIVSNYEELPRRLARARGDEDLAKQWKLLSLLHIMNLSGLSAIHEETLREINRTFAEIITCEPYPVVQQYLNKIFRTLRRNIERFPVTGLNCILNIGRGVYDTDDSDLVDAFIDGVVSLGFQAPEFQGVGDDWQIRANAAHIQNIRTWLELIELSPKWSKKLLSSLIIHLSLSGVLIRDTDLFPRDITRLLNTDIGPVYNLAKQLGRLLPAFFSDIGAEGVLRDISTQIDEICHRKDPLSHFLRKQSHVESSNQIIAFTEGVLSFWKTRDKEGLRPFLPPAVYEQIATEGLYIDGVYRVLAYLFEEMRLKSIGELLRIDKNRLKNAIAEVDGASDVDRERVILMIELYKLLYQKYHLDFYEVDGYLASLRSSGLPDVGDLRSALGSPNLRDRIQGLLAYLERLKEIILSSDRYEPKEDIYRKRHFTVDIPSMYGSYHELKFEALGLSFRLEALLNACLEDMVEQMDFKLITKATFHQIHEDLHLFDRALRIDGITSVEMAQQMDLLATSLEMRGFSCTQYLDIFRRFSQIVGHMVSDYFNNIHEENLLKILAHMPHERLVPKYRFNHRDEDPAKMAYRVTEIFLRDRIASSVGLQQLDLFLSRVLKTLYQQSHKLPKESLSLLLSYDPQKAVTPIHPVKKGLMDIIHLGNKGHNLAKMKELGLPVPPGFILTTEVFRCREVIDRYPPARRDLEEQVAKAVGDLEKATGKSFGTPGNSLLLSVRSGSSISQPGMMNTFLDVGINEDVVGGLIDRTGNEWFGWDAYRRFLQAYGMAFGLARDTFDAVIQAFKERIGVPYKRNFSGEEMRDVALAYRTLIQEAGIGIIHDPLEQLYIAIQKVVDSWNSPKAETFRRIMGISDDWGTAVTVQAMVFGNFSRDSGAGVFFTHNPRWSGDMILLWGDFTPGNQGEDVVSGLVNTHPISRKQAEIENREADVTLEAMFPEIYETIRTMAKELIYEQKWSPQEIEFTFEGPHQHNLYLLQTRDMAIRERKKADSLEPASQPYVEFLGHGIGVSGGAITGRAVFSLEEIKYWREKEPRTALIMVRSDTVPDDIKEIYEADGLLTARGGSTSHAAIVAHRLDKTCVVGFPGLICMENERICSFDGRRLASGDWISMDGLEGSVYAGRMNIQRMERR